MAKKQDTKAQELEQKIADLDKQIVESDKQLKRAVADYRNLEQRISQGRSELTSFVGAELVRKLLPVLDHLEQVVGQGRSTLSEQSESKGWFKGVEMAVKEFKGVLQAEGLEEVQTERI